MEAHEVVGENEGALGALHVHKMYKVRMHQAIQGFIYYGLRSGEGEPAVDSLTVLDVVLGATNRALVVKRVILADCFDTIKESLRRHIVGSNASVFLYGMIDNIFEGVEELIADAAVVFT